jgi:hypothetical protein
MGISQDLKHYQSIEEGRKCAESHCFISTRSCIIHKTSHFILRGYNSGLVLCLDWYRGDRCDIPNNAMHAVMQSPVSSKNAVAHANWP